MLKSSKLSHKPHKTSKDSAMRKSHLSKKSMRSRSPMELSGSSRSSSMKHISPGLKRGHPMSKRKASRSPRLHSIASSPHRSLSHRSKQESPVSMERTRSMKSPKYDKRKHLSNSPDRHLKPNFAQGSMIPLDARDFSPYSAERYQSAGAHSSQYASPTRKKVRRETDRYFSSQSMSASPPHRHPTAPLHPESHTTHRSGNISPVLHHKHRRNVPSGHGEREKHGYDERHKHLMSPPILQSSNSKEASMKVPYSNESIDRYRSSSHGERYPTGGQKVYGPTLHERFSTVIETNRHEPRIQYSREDLEKITIDIRNLREPSPTLRHIVNPSDVKLVRRANEGHRPIFDREEIKQAPRDMREDAYYERKKTSSSYSSAHGIDLREVENYQITRHRLDSHRDLFSSGSGRTLNDRWQNPEVRKESMSLDRDEREKQYERAPPPRNYVDARSRSQSGDRDFRSGRYLDAKPMHSRSEYPRPPPDIVEPRNNVPYAHRKSSMPIDARHKLNVRKNDRGSHSSSMHLDSKDSFHPHSDRHYSEAIPSSRVERRDHHSPIPEPTKWSYKSRSPSREKLEYSRRPERMGYKSWSDKPSIVPNRSNYSEMQQSEMPGIVGDSDVPMAYTKYDKIASVKRSSIRSKFSKKHESRDGPNSYHARGGSRPFRSSTGFRGFRGPSRGSSFRGSFRGFRGSMPMRGRGTFRR